MIHDLPGMNRDMLGGIEQAGVFNKMKSAPGFEGQ
jgi:hypothetical protein